MLIIFVRLIFVVCQTHENILTREFYTRKYSTRKFPKLRCLKLGNQIGETEGEQNFQTLRLQTNKEGTPPLEEENLQTIRVYCRYYGRQ